MPALDLALKSAASSSLSFFSRLCDHSCAAPHQCQSCDFDGGIAGPPLQVQACNSGAGSSRHTLAQPMNCFLS